MHGTGEWAIMVKVDGVNGRPLDRVKYTSLLYERSDLMSLQNFFPRKKEFNERVALVCTNTHRNAQIVGQVHG